MSVTSAFAFFDFYSKLSKQMPVFDGPGTSFECKITYNAGKSLWVRWKEEGKWEGQALDGWME